MHSTQWPHWEPRSDAGVSAWQACSGRRRQMQQFDLSSVDRVYSAEQDW